MRGNVRACFFGDWADSKRINRYRSDGTEYREIAGSPCEKA
jgi:hypothetical protein